MKISIACDHGGLDLKNMLRDYLGEQGYEVVDFGTYTGDSCDYPDFAHPCAEAVHNRYRRKHYCQQAQRRALRPLYKRRPGKVHSSAQRRQHDCVRCALHNRLHGKANARHIPFDGIRGRSSSTSCGQDRVVICRFSDGASMYSRANAYK